MKDSSSRKLQPWVVVDPGSKPKREWVLPQALQYCVVQNRDTGTWFICDRWEDAPVPGTESSTRPVAIRRFYRWCKREMPKGMRIGKPLAGVVHY
ncbi:MAG: hypothetical protein ACLQU3_26710 [Limisphaerales bacterium]